MRAVAVHRGAREHDLVGRILCHDLRGDRNEIVFRKGHALRADDFPLLIALPWSEIHLLELGPDDIGQREAGRRLAEGLAGAATRTVPSGHRHILRARHNGLLKIDVAALQRLNSIPGIAVFTLLGDQVVSAEEVVAEAQITPLAIEHRSIEAAEQIARECIRILPFVPRGVIVWMRDDRLKHSLTEKLRWFGCPILDMVELPRDAAAIRQAMERRRQPGTTLFLVSGSNALDPLDPIFGALQQLGAKIQRMGIPVHPGTLLWIASWNDIAIIGLPSCGLGTPITAFDLILPRLLAEGSIRDEDLAALGHGGILNVRRNVILSREDGPEERKRRRDGEVSPAGMTHVDEPVR